MKLFTKIKYTIQALIAVIFVISFLEKIDVERHWNYELDELLKKYKL